MIKNLLILTITLAIAGSAAAQSPKAAEQQKSKPATQAASAPSNVDGKFTILSSHIKSIGTIGKTSRYTIVSARVRGLDSPNISALLAYDDVTDTLAVLASGVEPGLGVAIVNGGATVGGNFLFGSKLRPDRTSVNNNSDSDADAEAESEGSYSRSEGGNALSVSKSEGGAGGTAVSVSNADADAKSASVSSVKNSNSVRNSNSNTSVNSNINANSNQQSQGQIQGQVQGQSNSNHNHNKPAPAPKKSKKSKKPSKH